jgi:PKD repeat protein
LSVARPGASISVRALFIAGALLLLVVLPAPAATSTPSDAGRASVALVGPTPGVCSAGVALTALPAVGPVPLIVDFEVTLPPSSGSPQFNWTFGDGATWNGTGLGFAGPEHVYLLPGRYLATENTSFAGTTYHCSIMIVAASVAVTPHIAATPIEGSVPLMVRLVGSAVGGSGTYGQFGWSFGDGVRGSGADTNHTYESPGEFQVVLNVTDSNGSSGRASLEISVAPDRVVPVWEQQLTPWLPWVFEGTALAMAATLFGLLVWRRANRRRVSSGSPRGPAPTEDISPETRPSEVEADAHSPSSFPDPPPGGLGKSGPVPPGVVRVSQRIITHLASQGILRENDVPTVRLTQAGIQASVGVSRSSVSNALRRLETAGIVRGEVRHVEGGARRVRVYVLTDQGWAISRDLRSRTR